MRTNANNLFLANRLVSLLKQRFPFLLVECITSYLPHKAIKGKKTFSSGDIWSGLSLVSQNKCIPLFLLIETLGQLSEILIRASFTEVETKTGILAAVDKMDILGNAECGDIMEIESVLENRFSNLYVTRTMAFNSKGTIVKATFVHTFK